MDGDDQTLGRHLDGQTVKGGDRERHGTYDCAHKHKPAFLQDHSVAAATSCRDTARHVCTCSAFPSFERAFQPYLPIPKEDISLAYKTK